MPDCVTRDDLPEDRGPVSLIHAFMNRIDEVNDQVAQVNRAIERLMGIGDARLRRLEASETTTSDRLRIVEQSWRT